MVRFVCPLCHFSVSAEDSARGTRVICNGCGKTIFVPNGRFEEGCIIGDFVINSHLGKGSIGDVYKATQISLDRPVALKILTPKFMTAKGVADFLKEARQASSLSHMNLVQSYAIGTDAKCIYMAMTYIKGESLRTRLKREGKIPVDESLHIIQQVAEALYYVWDECRMIHRDVKPDNIMLTEKGIVKLTDLGLAMNQSEWSEDMDISGSPSYMSPEQFAGEKLDTRSDIYSLGVTLYQMLTGTLPFDAATVTSVANQHFAGGEKPLTQLLPGLPPEVSSLVHKMMAVNPDDRFANMEELLKAIWVIRQNTAPDRQMVPDVHTISIKRLDYEIQNERFVLKQKKEAKSEAVRSSIKAAVSENGKRRLIRLQILLAAAVIFLSISVFFLIRSWSRNKYDAEIDKKIEDFEILVEDPAYSLSMLRKDQDDLIEYLHLHGSGETLHFKENHIRYLYLNRIHHQLVRHSNDLEDQVEQLNRKLSMQNTATNIKQNTGD